MREKIEKWLDGYIAVLDAHTSYPDLKDEGIVLCDVATYIHIYTGFDTIADVLGLDVEVTTKKSRIDKRIYISKSAVYKGHQLVYLEEIENE